MSDMHWTNYVAVGTGVAGFIMGCISYRRSNKLKFLDLELKLKNAISDSEFDLQSLRELVLEADKSKKSSYAARGFLKSGLMEKWKNQTKIDREKISELNNKLNELKTNIESLRVEKLQFKLAEIHKIQYAIEALIDKYKSSKENEEKKRKEYLETSRHFDNMYYKNK